MHPCVVSGRSGILRPFHSNRITLSRYRGSLADTARSATVIWAAVPSLSSASRVATEWVKLRVGG